MAGFVDNNNALFEKLVFVNRVSKVVKGGRRFGFAALVVVGDREGRFGIGMGKGKEVNLARNKAVQNAKRSMVRVPLRDGRTIHHDIVATFKSVSVCMRTAEQGRGIIAGGPVRAIFEALGVQDVVVKLIGSSNPYNVVKAVQEGLLTIKSPKYLSSKRGKKIGEVVAMRNKTVLKNKKNEQNNKNVEKNVKVDA